MCVCVFKLYIYKLNTTKNAIKNLHEIGENELKKHEIENASKERNVNELKKC